MTSTACVPARSRPRRAVIVGGSIAGLFAALLLERAGCEVDVFERSAGNLESRGAGIVTHPELFDILRGAGIAIDPASIGIRVPGRCILGRSGEVSAEADREQVMTSWGRLYNLLRENLSATRLHHARRVVRVEEAPGCIALGFADGGEIKTEFLIGADGLFSSVREAFLPGLRPSYAGYIAWRGIVEEADLSPAARAVLCQRFVFCLPEGEQMLGYPVAGPGHDVASGQRRFNFVWYRPADPGGELAHLLTDVDGVRHELSIPPDRIRGEVIAAMRSDAERLLSPQFAEAVCRTAQPFIQAILDFEAPSMVLGGSGRTALLGDAAFVARPHVGMGVTKAAGDAAARGAALAQHGGEIEAALSRFDARRRPYGAAVVGRARELGAYMQARRTTSRERLMAERHRTPAAVLAETAVAPDLRS